MGAHCRVDRPGDMDCSALNSASMAQCAAKLPSLVPAMGISRLTYSKIRVAMKVLISKYPNRFQFFPSVYAMAICVVASLVTLVLLTACGKRPADGPEYPLPGHMQLVSLEVMNRMYASTNLIPNGDFSEWPSGAPAPDGFRPPANRDISRVLPIEPRGGPGRHSADQWWYESDQNAPYQDLFHTVVPGIQAGRVYEMYVHCISLYDATVSLSIVALDHAGTALGVWPDLIVVTPGDVLHQEHFAKIQATHNGSLVIAAHSNANTKFRARINWLEWRLMETELENGETAVRSTAMN